MTNPTAHASTDAPAKKTVVLIFVGLMIAMLMASLGQTVLSTALPTIVGELGGVDQMTWVITGYILATTIGMLILTRVIQGMGGGGLMVLSQSAVADVIPARDRGKYMGILGASFAVSSVAGPLLGGWLTEGPGWRWAFWINVPLGILALVGVALVASVATVWVEKRAANPVLPLGMFANLNFTLTVVVGLLTGSRAWACSWSRRSRSTAPRGSCAPTWPCSAWAWA